MGKLWTLKDSIRPAFTIKYVQIKMLGNNDCTQKLKV